MTNVLEYLVQASANPDLLLTTILLPFLLIFVIMWGALRLVGIFGRDSSANKINLVISLVITIFVAFTDAWGVIATQLAAISGVFIYVVFFIVLIIGTIFWAVGRTKYAYDVHWTHLKSYKDVNKIDKEIGKLAKKYKDLRQSGKEKEAQAVLSTIGILEKRKEEIILGKKYE